jgi:hypothetical protein
MTDLPDAKDHGSSKTCRICTSAYSPADHPSWFGICEHCAYKVLIVIVVVMVAVSYIAWFGVF